MADAVSTTNPYEPRRILGAKPAGRLRILGLLLPATWIAQLLIYAYCRYGLSLKEVVAKLILAVSILPPWILCDLIAKRSTQSPYLRALIKVVLLILCLINVLVMPSLVDAYMAMAFPE